MSADELFEYTSQIHLGATWMAASPRSLAVAVHKQAAAVRRNPPASQVVIPRASAAATAGAGVRVAPAPLVTQPASAPPARVW